jgi:hypothetical protein
MVFHTIQQQPILKTGDLKRYRGKWVAIRSGKVIAHADHAANLKAMPKVKRGDTIFLVPTEHSNLHIA